MMNPNEVTIYFSKLFIVVVPNNEASILYTTYLF